MGKEQDLLDASRNGHFAAVEKVLSSRIKKSGPLTLTSLRRLPGPNTTDPRNGFTCLHYASLNGHKDIVHILLEHGANPNIVDHNGSSPLHLASWTGDYEVVKLLISNNQSGHHQQQQHHLNQTSAGINLKNKDNETALHSACQYGHTAVVSLLLSQGADPFIRNIRAETALDLAAQYGRLETIELLLQMRFDLLKDYLPVNRDLMMGTAGANRPPHSPLHLASRNGHKQVVKLLIDLGFDVDFLTTGGTALHEAVLCGKVEVVRLLLEAGSDIFMENDRGQKVDELIAGLNTSVARQTKRLIQEHMRSIMSSSARSHRSGGAGSGGHNLAFSPVSDSTTLAASVNDNSYSYGGGGGGDTTGEDLTLVDSIVLGPDETGLYGRVDDFEDDLMVLEDDTEVECISPPPGYSDQVVVGGVLPPDVIPAQLLEEQMQLQFGGGGDAHLQFEGVEGFQQQQHLLPHSHHHRQHNSHHHHHNQQLQQQHLDNVDNVSPSSSLFSSSILSELQSIFDEHLNRNSADERNSQEFTEDPFNIGGSSMKPSTSFTLSDYRAQNRASATSDIVAHHQSFDAVYLSHNSGSSSGLLHPLEGGGSGNQLMSTSLTSNENFGGSGGDNGASNKPLSKRHHHHHHQQQQQTVDNSSSNYSLASSASHQQPRPPKPPRKASAEKTKLLLGQKSADSGEDSGHGRDRALLAASVDSLAKSDYNVDYTGAGTCAAGTSGTSGADLSDEEEEEERSMPSQRAPKPANNAKNNNNNIGNGGDSDHSSAHLSSVISNDKRDNVGKQRSTSAGKKNGGSRDKQPDSSGPTAQTTAIAFTQSIDDFYLLYDQVANSSSIERSPLAKKDGSGQQRRQQQQSNNNSKKHSSSLDDILSEQQQPLSKTAHHQQHSPKPPSPRSAESDILLTIEPLKQQFQQMQPPARRKRKKKDEPANNSNDLQCQTKSEQKAKAAANKRDNWTLTDFPEMESVPVTTATTSSSTTATLTSGDTTSVQSSNTSPRKRSVAVWTVEANNRENSSLVANRVQVKKKMLSEGRKPTSTSVDSPLEPTGKVGQVAMKNGSSGSGYNAYCETLHFDRKGEKGNPFAGLCRGGLTPAKTAAGKSNGQTGTAATQPTAPERAKKKTVELSEARKSLRGKRAILSGRAESLTKLSKLSVYQPEVQTTTTTSASENTTNTIDGSGNHHSCIGPVQNIYATLRKSKKKCKSLNGDQISTSLAGLGSSGGANIPHQSGGGASAAVSFDSGTGGNNGNSNRIGLVGSESWNNLLKAQSARGGQMSEAASNRAASNIQRTHQLYRWLKEMGMETYKDLLIANGYDDLHFMDANVMDDSDLLEIGIVNAAHREVILGAAALLPKTAPKLTKAEIRTLTVPEWLAMLHLEQYRDSFARNGIDELRKVHNIWEVELETMLEIDRSGYRRRIMYSLSDFNRESILVDDDDIASWLTDVQSSANETEKEQSDGQLISDGKQNGSKPFKEWKHPRQELLSGCCQYSVRYLGSTLVRELRGIDSTRASMGKLKSAHASVPPMQIPKIILSISCQGVQFRDFKSNHLICEHEIRNIHCICQDSEDLNYFAYITKDLESNNHYCHVFMSQQTDLVTEIILTLGQAFEIAYQIVLEQYNIHVTAANEVQVTTDNNGKGGGGSGVTTPAATASSTTANAQQQPMINTNAAAASTTKITTTATNGTKAAPDEISSKKPVVAVEVKPSGGDSAQCKTSTTVAPNINSKMTSTTTAAAATAATTKEGQITSTTTVSSSTATTAAPAAAKSTTTGSKLNFFKQKGIASQVFLVAAKFRALDEASQDAMLETGESGGGNANQKEVNTVKYESHRKEEEEGKKKAVEEMEKERQRGEQQQQCKGASQPITTTNHHQSPMDSLSAKSSTSAPQPPPPTSKPLTSRAERDDNNNNNSNHSTNNSISEDIYAVVDKSKKVRRKSSITSSTSDYQTVAAAPSPDYYLPPSSTSSFMTPSVTPEPSLASNSSSNAQVRPVPPVRSTSTTGRPEIKPKPPIRVASMGQKPEVSPKPRNLSSSRETATPTPPLISGISSSSSSGIYSRGNVKPSIAARQAALISSTSPQPPPSMTPSPAPSH